MGTGCKKVKGLAKEHICMTHERGQHFGDCLKKVGDSWLREAEGEIGTIVIT